MADMHLTRLAQCARDVSVVCSEAAVAHRPVPKIIPQKLGAQVPDDPRPRRDVTYHEACIHLYGV